MAIGMTYEEYWYGDPLMVRAFYEAWKLKKKQQDELAWLNGLYVAKALNATVMNAFKKQGSQPETYPEKPILCAEEEKNKAKTEEQEEMEALYAMAYMENMVLAGKGWHKNK